VTEWEDLRAELAGALDDRHAGEDWSPHTFTRGGTMKEHFVKCWPEYFAAAWEGVKPFENRQNDRQYQKGDRVTMQEWNPTSGQYTGRWITGTIIYQTDMGLQPGWITFAWREEGRGGRETLRFDDGQ
jgi:hypothetical protein